MNNYSIAVLSNESLPNDMLKICSMYGEYAGDIIYQENISTPYKIEFFINVGTKDNQIEFHRDLSKKYQVNFCRDTFHISKEKLIDLLLHELMYINPVISPSVFYGDHIDSCERYEKCNKTVHKLNELCNKLEKDTDELFGKYKIKGKDIVVKVINNKKHVYMEDADYDSPCALRRHGFEDTEEDHIKNQYYFLVEDISRYKEMIDNLVYNYKEIKHNIGNKNLNNDNKWLKNSILYKQKQLHDLKQEYVWE